MAVRAGHDTGLSAGAALAPQAGPAELRRAVEGLRQARARLAKRSGSSILAALEAVVESWLSFHSAWRQQAESLLPEATGFSPEMVRHALPFMIEPLRAPALAELFDDELGGRQSLGGFAGGRRARAPGLILHVLSGNLPGLAAVPMTASLALGSSALVKAASGDRVFPAAWARSIADHDTDLGACLAPVYWRGGDPACEAEAFRGADLVVVSGSDGAVADARTRCPGRFIGHGHKISFAVVTGDVLRDDAERAASRLAYDVSLWDQKGCLSPQMCYVEGDFASALAFARRLVAPLGELARSLPPGRTTVEEQVAVQRFRAAAEWEGISSAKVDVIAPDDSLDWSIVVEEDPTLRPTPLCRSLRVVPFANEAELARALAPARRFLEAAGIAAPADRARRLGETLARAGVNRLCPLGVMQRPPLSWRQGGRPRIGDWVEWSIDEG